MQNLSGQLNFIKNKGQPHYRAPLASTSPTSLHLYPQLESAQTGIANQKLHLKITQAQKCTLTNNKNAWKNFTTRNLKLLSCTRAHTWNSPPLGEIKK
jgi:hypothetical protein